MFSALGTIKKTKKLKKYTQHSLTSSTMLLQSPQTVSMLPSSFSLPELPPELIMLHLKHIMVITATLGLSNYT